MLLKAKIPLKQIVLILPKTVDMITVDMITSQIEC